MGVHNLSLWHYRFVGGAEAMSRTFGKKNISLTAKGKGELYFPDFAESSNSLNPATQLRLLSLIWG
jgi:hypothetical protein